MGDYAKPDPPIPNTEIVIKDVPAATPRQPDPKPTVTVSKDGDITIS